MAEAFFYLRKSIGRNPQILYMGLRHGENQIAVPTGVKILPARWDSEKSKVKIACKVWDIKLPMQLHEKCQLENLDIAGAANNYLKAIANYANSKTYLPTTQLKKEIVDFVNGRNEVEQFAFDLECFIKTQIIKEGLTKEKLIEAIDKYLYPPTDKITLFGFIEKFIDDSINGRRLINGQKVNDRTIKRYATTKQILQDFQKTYKQSIDFETIDLDFYKDFNAFMTVKKDYAPATMGKHISTLKTFLHAATEEGININLKYQSKSFKAVEAVSDEIYLNEVELAAMYALDLSDNIRLDRVRDLFLIGANTGLRFSDFTTIKAHNLKKVANGYNLEIIPEKTKDRVVIPVNGIVKDIMTKYSNVLPPPISNQKFNDYLKEVAEKVPQLHELDSRVFVKGGKEHREEVAKWKRVATHTARRSFATNAFKNGQRAQNIMAITGHRSEKAFMAYLKLSAYEYAEITRKYQS